MTELFLVGDMSSNNGTMLAHRSISNIRTGSARSPTAQGQSGPTSPHTPSRTSASAFGSPSILRADDDIIVVEIGSRFVRAGYAGEALPKAVLQLGPERQRRVGDERIWRLGYHDDWALKEQTNRWGQDHELWQYDLRDLDLGLVEDKLDRVLREAFTQYALQVFPPLALLTVGMQASVDRLAPEKNRLCLAIHVAAAASVNCSQHGFQ
jgi:hypothetical protein